VIALIGESVIDRVRWPDGRIVERLGGAPIYAGRALAGTATAVVLTHGGSRRLRQPMFGLGHEVVEGPPSGTTAFEVTLFGDGGCVEAIRSFGAPFVAEDVAGWMAPALARCSTVVCGTQWRGDLSADTVAALAAGGRRMFLDGQGMTRPRRLGPIRLDTESITPVFSGVQVLKLGEDEANVLIGGIDAARARATGIPVVVVTLAERGAVVLAEGVATEVGVSRVAGLSDTVGAGDSFLALMAAAAEAGADPITATGIACDGVAALLRQRRAGERVDDVVASR
jgi:hypothetical protein